LIYKEFGISLGRTVASQQYSGTYVSKSDLMPGDLVFYSYGSVASHVAIYIGDGLIIHESTPRDGVKISSVNIMNYITARRLITSNVTSKVESNIQSNKPSNNEPVVKEEVKTENVKKVIEPVVEKQEVNTEKNVVSKKEEEIKKEKKLIVKKRIKLKKKQKM